LGWDKREQEEQEQDKDRQADPVSLGNEINNRKKLDGDIKSKIQALESKADEAKNQSFEAVK
jgi:hypothetical protein